MKIAVYLASSMGKNPIYQRDAEALGAWIGDHGHTLVYGGSQSGTMGVLAYSSMRHNAKVIGVMPKFLIERGRAEIQLTQMITVDNMDVRKQKMMDLADCFVALPGGPGTLEEISEVISAIRLQILPKPAFLLNEAGFYEPLRQMYEKMAEEEFITEKEYEAICFVNSLEALEDKLADCSRTMESAR